MSDDELRGAACERNVRFGRLEPFDVGATIGAGAAWIDDILEGARLFAAVRTSLDRAIGPA